MSSISVVGNVQRLDTNKKTSSDNQNGFNDDSKKININKDSSTLPEQSDILIDSPSSSSIHPENVTESVYSKDNKTQYVEPEVNLVVPKNNLDVELQNENKLAQLKNFSKFFIPVYTFFKDFFSCFNMPENFHLNLSFAPVVKFVNDAKDTAVSFCQSVKKVVCNTFEIIKDFGKKVYDYSVNLGKKLFSKFFSSSSDEVVEKKPEVHDNLVTLSPKKEEVKEEATTTTTASHRSIRKPRSIIIDSAEYNKPYWKSLDKINGPDQIVSSGKKFYNHFLSLKKTPRLDNSFLFEGQHSILQVNGKRISKVSPQAMLDSFKNEVPDLESRQLISSYANQGILSQPYVELFAEHPDLINFKPKDSHFSYVVRQVGDGRFMLTATSQADLELAYETSEHKKYNEFGVQASMLLSKDQAPNIKYAYYLR